jgi:hypothetical protein
MVGALAVVDRQSLAVQDRLGCLQGTIRVPEPPRVELVKRVIRRRILKDRAPEPTHDEPHWVLRIWLVHEMSATAPSEGSTPRSRNRSRNRCQAGRSLSRMRRVDRRCSGSTRNLVLRISPCGERCSWVTASFDSATPRSPGSRSELIHSASSSIHTCPRSCWISNQRLAAMIASVSPTAHVATVPVKPFVSRSRTLYRALPKCQPRLVFRTS